MKRLPNDPSELVNYLAREHIKPFGRKAKLISARRVDNWNFQVEFSHADRIEKYNVVSYVKLADSSEENSLRQEMRATPRGKFLQRCGLEPYDTEYQARRVAEHAVKELKAAARNRLPRKTVEALVKAADFLTQQYPEGLGEDLTTFGRAIDAAKKWLKSTKTKS